MSEKSLILEKIETAIGNLHQLLKRSETVAQIEAAAEWILQTIRAGKKLLICGNGGSAADSQHMAAEFIGRFYLERRALSAIALTTNSSILTCLANDYSYDEVFSRQVEGIGNEGDLLIGISTSGVSKNILRAFQSAKQKKIRTILLSGERKREIAEISDLAICVPSSDTPRIQEMHLLIEHMLSEIVEKRMFNG